MSEPKQTASMFLTVMEVARMLGVSVDSIRYYERTGKLTATKLKTGERIFLPFEVDRFLLELKARRGRGKREKMVN